MDEMIQLFEVEKVHTSAAAFNPEKLLWLNQHYIKTAEPKHVAQHLAYHLGKLGIDPSGGPDLVEIVMAQRERAKTLVELLDNAEYLFVKRPIKLDAQAEKSIADIEARFAQIKKDHPDFAGKTAAVGFYFQEKPGAYSSTDARSRIMTDMGFVIPKKFDELAGSAFYFYVSNEQITMLDTDVIVWLSSTDEGLESIRKMPLRPQLKAVSQGREVFVGKLLGGAFSFGSPLSINYLLDNLVPKLEAAVDGNPSTAVP